MNTAEFQKNLLRLNSHLSNERTYLSYLRTSLSMISFGVTVNRLALYLKAVEKAKNGHNTQFFFLNTASFGVVMVALGITLMVWSMVRYRQIYEDINNSTFRKPFRYIVLLTSLIILLGLATLLWMGSDF